MSLHEYEWKTLPLHELHRRYPTRDDVVMELDQPTSIRTSPSQPCREQTRPSITQEAKTITMEKKKRSTIEKKWSRRRLHLWFMVLTGRGEYVQILSVGSTMRFFPDQAVSQSLNKAAEITHLGAIHPSPIASRISGSLCRNRMKMHRAQGWSATKLLSYPCFFGTEFSFPIFAMT